MPVEQLLTPPDLYLTKRQSVALREVKRPIRKGPNGSRLRSAKS